MNPREVCVIRVDNENSDQLVPSCLCDSRAFAQSRTDATLRITVVDESGGVIVGARVDVKPLAGGDPVTLDTGGRGDATFAALVPGRYAIHVEAPGFEPHDTRDLRVRVRRQPARNQARRSRSSRKAST